ncbi:hypothetical protein IT568_08025 [bacterium]|nr:hypothetical protein [bacterium]
MGIENLIVFLADRYSRRGYRVYSSIIPDYQNKPDDWEGQAPDLLVIKGKEKKVFAVETVDTLEDEAKIILKWDNYNANHKIEFEVLVNDEEAYNIAKRIKNENKFKNKVTLMVSQNVHKRRSAFAHQTQQGRKQNIKRYVTIATVIIVVGMALGFFFKTSQNEIIDKRDIIQQTK